MLPSQTVENYLKTIFLAQAARPAPDELVPMGQIASALGVVPGTATTMVKALSESGLVHYEPYMGVRLTPAGEKLAGLVLRRHRLVELFLVKVLGMNWTEVHDEAEQLEHAVSERLIERIDAMLGHPAVDPHGDPIPSAEGHVQPIDAVDLTSVPESVEVRVTRVIDQEPEFLRFIERSDLTPGRGVTVRARDTSSDAVHLTTDSGRTVTIGMRAAAKVLVRMPPAPRRGRP
jgi:DtxR family transcriptional regulator, Mn-dependent transcriptional regulator